MSLTEHLDAVTELTDEYLSVTPPAPKSVKIELTSRCIFDCSFCARNIRNDTPGDMDRALYMDIVIELHEIGVKELGLFYLGESFLVDWLPMAIAFAKDTGFNYVFLTTNGAAAGPEKVHDCMAAGLDSLKFSLNWADREQFEAIARVKPDLFDTALRNLASAREMRDAGGFKTRLSGSYIRYDGAQGVKMAALVDRVRPYLDEVYELPLYNQGASVENPDWEFSQGNRGRMGALREPLPCWSIFTEGHVNRRGKVSACCFDHDERFVMGDLTDTTFMDVWHGVKFQELRKAHLLKDVTNTVCEKCVA